MNPSLLPLIERIIRSADREHPADAQLRQELKAQRDLFPGDAAYVTKAVFAYFRWLGWLDEGQPIQERIKQALQLAERYVLQPESFTDAELIARAVPAWLPTVMTVTGALVRALQRGPRLWLRARRGQAGVLAGRLGDCRVVSAGPLARINTVFAVVPPITKPSVRLLPAPRPEGATTPRAALISVSACVIATAGAVPSCISFFARNDGHCVHPPYCGQVWLPVLYIGRWWSVKDFPWFFKDAIIA